RSENIGISALLRSSNIPSGAIVSDDIAFQLAPKINAAGRMGKVDASLELLLCSDTAKADKLADTLTSLNTKRKKVCADILEYTLNINTNQLIFNDNCIILSGEFHQGVIGIAASQLVKAHGLPVILFTRDLSIQGRSVLKGSGRSVAGVDLFALLCQCDRYILKYGGHPMAAGLSIFEENFEKFKRVFSKMLTASMTETAGLADSRIDMELSVEKFFEKGMAEQINRLEPFGVGNRRPVFLDRSATLYDYRLLGKKGDHLRLYFRCRHSNRQGMAFNLGHKKDILQAGGTRGIIYSPTLSRYNNSASWEIRILDIF
ncbi:MAG: DHHA1 domain-containing protein, partial [Desulfocapsaceae bacterium]|nr:DHHA1 domain-containing protein [Desulfocapsaceae bacterium]